jgi:uncharacterized protein DUF6941
MEVVAAMLADAAESFNGKLFVHGGGWDSLIMRAFPGAHPSMALVALLSADAGEAPGTGEFRVQLVDEDGLDSGVGAAAALAVGHGPLHRLGQRSQIPIAIPFQGIRFDKPGTYEFRMFWNGQPLDRSVAFSVIAAPQMPALSQIGQPTD